MTIEKHDHVIIALNRNCSTLTTFTTSRHQQQFYCQLVFMAQTGLLEWANSVRLTMANDPGRKSFQDQVQTYGFLFLDDYLDNILSDAKQQ